MLFCVLVVLCAVMLMPRAESTADTYGSCTLDPYDGGLHYISELNCEIGELDSHAGECNISTLEVDLRRTYHIDNGEFISEGNLWYPRLKLLSNGEYLLFFQDGRWGPNVFYTRSRDGLEWDEPTLLFESHPTYNNTYTRYYATCDALELSDGTLVVAAIFHASRKTPTSAAPSRWLMTEKGIVTKYSTDLGDSWSEPQVVYHGRCWEPSFLELPDGTVQMYFTHSAPKDAIYGTKMGNKVSSGVAMLTSSDHGRNWEPIVLEYPYVAKRIAQQQIFEYNGIQILTDQMPVAILLHDQKTIVMSAESLRPDESGHSTSIIRSHDFFARTLEENEYGPEDRDDMLVTGAAPYIVQFPSGEVILSNFSGLKQKVYIGNETAEEFYLTRSFNPFPSQKVAMWGDLFVADSHTLLASSGDTIVEKGVVHNLASRGLGISHMVLNHRIDAKTATMNVDGDTSDWYDNTDALFVGSISQAQTSMRVAHDEDDLYLLFEHIDNTLTDKDYFYFFVSDGSSVKYRIKGTPKAVDEVARIEGKKTVVLPQSQWRGQVRVYGTCSVNTDIDEGCVIELAMDRNLFGDVDTLYVFMKMYNNDGGETYTWDGFNGLTESKMETWHRVRLSDTVASTTPPAVAPETSTGHTPATNVPEHTFAETTEIGQTTDRVPGTGNAAVTDADSQRPVTDRDTAEDTEGQWTDSTAKDTSAVTDRDTDVRDTGSGESSQQTTDQIDDQTANEQEQTSSELPSASETDTDGVSDTVFDTEQPTESSAGGIIAVGVICAAAVAAVVIYAILRKKKKKT